MLYTPATANDRFAPLKAQTLKLLSDLSVCYTFYKSGATYFDFFDDVVVLIDSKCNFNIDDPAGIFEDYIAHTDQTKDVGLDNSLLKAVIIGTVYSRKASYADREKDAVLAASYLSDGRYWYGVAQGSLGLEKVMLEAFENARNVAHKVAVRKQGQAGASVKKAKLDLVKQFAFDEVRRRMPAGRWASKTHAVRSIQDAVIAYSSSVLSAPLRKAEEGREGRCTLHSWFSKMPDANEIFQFGNRGDK